MFENARKGTNAFVVVEKPFLCGDAIVRGALEGGKAALSQLHNEDAW